MTAEQDLFESEAREKILHGAERLADAVRIMLGPKSKLVLLEKRWGAPVVCNDGETIAKELEPESPEENLGALRPRNAAEARSATARARRRRSRTRFSRTMCAIRRRARARLARGAGSAEVHPAARANAP